MHHAYLLVGSAESAEEYLHELVGDLRGSPDYFIYKEPVFGVDSARALAEAAVKRAFTGRKTFLITPEKITLEAQNALLKTFEEPIEDTHFFLVLREEELVIPTLRSRMQTIHVRHSVSHNEAEKFCKLGPKERINFVKKFVDNEENLSVFLDKLMLCLRRENKHELLGKVFEARRFSDDRAASSRLILEHLAVVLP